MESWWPFCGSWAHTINSKQLSPSTLHGKRHHSVSHSLCFLSSCILQRRRDFLQWMLDSRNSADALAAGCFDVISPATTTSQNEVPPAGKTPSEKVQKTLTEDEIAGQAFLFLIAGYETTTSTLSFATYLLATHPECQEKVLQEIDEFSAKHVSTIHWHGGSKAMWISCQYGTWMTRFPHLYTHLLLTYYQDFAYHYLSFPRF